MFYGLCTSTPKMLSECYQQYFQDQTRSQSYDRQIQSRAKTPFGKIANPSDICESGLGTRLSQVWLFKVDNLEYIRGHHHTYSSLYSPYYACAARFPDHTFHAHRKNGSGQLRRLYFTLCGNDQLVKWTLIRQHQLPCVDQAIVSVKRSTCRLSRSLLFTRTLLNSESS